MDLQAYSKLQQEHIELLAAHHALYQKYNASLDYNIKTTQELTASIKKQCELMETIETLRNNILDRIDDASKKFALHVTIGAFGVLVVKFSIDFFVWLAQ